MTHPTRLLKHFISRTFTFLLSALLIPAWFCSAECIGTITHSYRHFLAFIPNPLLLSTLFSASHTLYPSFILCTTSLSHPPTAATYNPKYFKQSTSSNGSPFSITMHLTHISITWAPHNFTLTNIHSQLNSFVYSTKLTHQSTQLLLWVSH